jgi:serine phosphatase RsbU (regulator of sigma subunit)
LKMKLELGNQKELSLSYGNIGSLYTILKKYKDAESYLLKSLNIADSIGSLEMQTNQHKSLSDLYTKTGKYLLALDHYKKSILIRDSMFNKENTEKLVRSEMNFEFEKKQAIEKSENEKKEAIARQEKQKQRIILFSVVAGLIVVLFFSVSLFNRFKLTEKQKKIIEGQKEEVEKKNEMIEEKQNAILDSINYAKRIQIALLASDKLLKDNLHDYFVLFKPKDIVAGDFYWGSVTPEGFIYVTGDCTGHGVPGAFMSLLNISMLSEAINQKQILRPDLILNHVRREIIQALNPEGSAEESKDGMDVIICKLDLEKMKLEFAAANSSFIIVRNNEIIHCKCDKMPVGKSYDNNTLFTYNTINLSKGDVIYTFTDGYADQFGGPKGKKYKYKQLENLLLSNSHFSMAEQKQLLDDFFENWKGVLEQVDDVCVIGVRV